MFPPFPCVVALVLAWGLSPTVAFAQKARIVKADRKTLASHFTFQERGEEIVLGNRHVTYTFRKDRGGALSAVALVGGPAWHLPGGALEGAWKTEWEDATQEQTATPLVGGEYRPGAKEAVLTLHAAAPQGEWRHEIRLGAEGAHLHLCTSWRNTTGQARRVQAFHYVLSGIAIGGAVEGNRYLYPPTWLHYMAGPISEATPEAMEQRYVYGWAQPVEKMMLPYALIHQEPGGGALGLAAVQSTAKGYVGALHEGGAGQLAGRFYTFRQVPAGGELASGEVWLRPERGGKVAAMEGMRALLMAEAGFRAMEGTPKDLKDLVIVWDGVPGFRAKTFDDLAAKLAPLKEAGVSGMIVGGKVWHCPATGQGEGTIFDYIPIPQHGRIEPAPDLGGPEGFRRLIAQAHSLGMKLFTWGPASMAGVARQSPEATAEPDWWIYKEDGSFNDWYHFMAPANPAAPGWRRFFVENVGRLLGEYRFDGVWLDSTWQDHGLNHRSATGWLGEPNGAKLGLVEEIATAARAAHPQALIMAEGAGAELYRRVDVAYLQVHGIWPALAPERMQEFLEAQELCRLPGVRPFGQVELGLGFYGELKDPASRALAQEHAESWVAKTFLVSTLERVPVYFGMNGVIDPPIHNLPALNPTAERWFSVFKRINHLRARHLELREGATRFDLMATAAPASLIHYVRENRAERSYLLLNAGKAATTARFTFTPAAGLEPRRAYRLRNLMAEPEASAPIVRTGAEWLREGVSLPLEGYEGAVLKLEPVSP